MKKTETGKILQVIILMVLLSSSFIFSVKVMAIEKTLIFPIPQQIQITNDIFILDETMSIIVPRDMSKNDIFLARFLVRELSDKYGIAVKIETRTDIPKDRKVVVMGRFDNPLIQRILQRE